MRHRIKSSKIGSFDPETLKLNNLEAENESISEEVVEIFEEDSEYRDDDEALEAMEFYETPDEQE